MFLELIATFVAGLAAAGVVLSPRTREINHSLRDYIFTQRLV